jgi:hypothetical protein
MGGALEGHAGAFFDGNVQPAQSGALKVPFAVEAVGPWPPDDEDAPEELASLPRWRVTPLLAPPLLVPPPP